MKRTIQKLVAVLLILSFVFGETRVVWAEEGQDNINTGEEVQEVSQESLALEVTAEASEDLKSGDKVVLYAQPTGGAGEYLYQFVDGNGQVLQEYSSIDKFEFEAQEGQNLIIVRVKDVSGNVAEEKYEVFAGKKQEPDAEGSITDQESETEESNVEDSENINNTEDIEKQETVGENTQLEKNKSAIMKKSAVPEKKAASEETLKVTVESSGTVQEYVSRTITLTAHAEGGDGNYQYKFTENYNGKDEICQDYGENNTYEFTTSGTGKHTYYVDVTDGTEQKARAVYTIYVVLHPSAALKGSLTNNKTSNEYIWRDITLTGEVTGGYGDLQYQFTEVYNGQSKVVQEYSEENSYSFRTEGVGRHVFYVDVKDQEGQTLRLSYTLNVVQNSAAVLKGKIVNNKTSNEYIWRDITLTGEVTGGYGDLQYQYTEVYGGKSTVVKNYSEDSAYTFRTKKAGLHTYYLDVKDEAGQTLRLSYTLNVVENPAAAISGKIVSNKTSKEYIERDITLTGEVTGGYGDLQYQYTEVYNGKSKIVKEYNDEAVYSFVTNGPGTHIYYLDVKDENGRTKRFSYTLNVVVHPSVIMTGKIVNNKTSNEYIWRDITLTGEVAGGYGELQYQYTEVYGGKSTVVKEYSEDPSYAFRTRKAGVHTYYLDVKDKGGQTLRLSYTLNVVENPAAVLRGTIISDKTAKEYIWRDIVLTGEISGGYGSLQYQYTEVYNGTSKVVQEYGDDPTYRFRTEGPGTHIYYLDVKDENGQTKRFSYTLNVEVHPTAVITGKIINNKTANEYIWRDIILTGEIAGGYGALQYQYTEVYNGASNVVQAYSDNPVYEFRTEGPGAHIYYLDVKDEGGQIVRFTYTLQVVVHPNYKLTGSFKSNVTGIAKENQAIQLTATSSGGYGEKREYRFRESFNGRTTVLQDYSEKSTCNFNIKGGGLHGYYVDIRDEGKQVLTLHLTISLGKNGWYYEGGYKFYYINNVKQLDLDGILPRQSSYYIKVNRTACTVTVYAKDGNNGYIIPVKRFACSVGLPSTPTPTGTYYTSNKYRWHTLMGPSYGQYCTRIVGGILFHSVAGRNMTSYNLKASDYNKLGSPASHGCVRLCVRDAKWIYDNCPSGTMVTIYDSSDPGPLGKPATIKIPAGQTWDPTDPNI